MGHEAKDAKPVAERHRDDPLRRHALAIIARLGTIARHEPAAIEIDKYRQLLPARLRRRPDVQIEAVLTHPIRTKVHVAKDRTLHTTGSELVRLAHPLPAGNRLRWLPAVDAHRRRAKRHPLETANPRLLRRPLKRAVGNYNPCLGGDPDTQDRR